MRKRKSEDGKKPPRPFPLSHTKQAFQATEKATLLTNEAAGLLLLTPSITQLGGR